MIIKLNDKKTIGAVMDFMSAHELNYDVISDDLELNIVSHENNSDECLLRFECIDDKGTMYIFRMSVKGGYWRFFDDMGTTIGQGKTDKLHLMSSWNDVKTLLTDNFIMIKDK